MEKLKNLVPALCVIGAIILAVFNIPHWWFLLIVAILTYE